jgi:hypothetical protein
MRAFAQAAAAAALSGGWAGRKKSTWLGRTARDVVRVSVVVKRREKVPNLSTHLLSDGSHPTLLWWCEVQPHDLSLVHARMRED